MEGTISIDHLGGPVSRRGHGGEFPQPRCDPRGLCIHHAGRHVLQSSRAVAGVGGKALSQLISQEAVKLGQTIGDPFLALCGTLGSGGLLLLSPFSGLGLLPARPRLACSSPLRGEPSDLTRFGYLALRPQEQQGKGMLAGELAARTGAFVCGRGGVDADSVRRLARPLAGTPQEIALETDVRPGPWLRQFASSGCRRRVRRSGLDALHCPQFRHDARG